MDARRMARSILLGLVLLAVSGCAVGRRHAYHTLKPQLPSAGPASATAGADRLVIAVHDLRAEVLSGLKRPEFVGLSRGGFGNPFDISTKSGEPLAEDVTRVIARGLGSAEYRVTAILVAHLARPEQVRAQLLQTGASALLLVRIHDLKSDTYTNTALHYNLEVLVMNGQGEVVGRALQHGKDNLGGSFWNPARYAEKIVPVAVERKLEELLNDPRIVRALRGTLSVTMKWPARPAPAAPAPSEEDTAPASFSVSSDAP